MDRIEFIEIIAECTAATQAYFAEAEKTTIMLRVCAEEPLTFDERFALLAQEIIERDAYLLYLDAKRFLHRAALLDMAGFRPTDRVTNLESAVSQNRGRASRDESEMPSVPTAISVK
jgi:hypothetical protein